MSQAELEVGDEIVMVRRRRRTYKDPETQEEKVETDEATLSIVRVPQKVTLFGGGTIQPEYVANDKHPNRDQQYLVIRYLCRLG